MEAVPEPHIHGSPAAAARPVFVIGAGGIVRDAHLPGYRTAGVRVAGVFDLDAARARGLAESAGALCFGTLDEIARACMREGGVFDVAVPPQSLAEILDKLPRGATVLLQKPFGRNLAEATALREAALRNGLVAAVNFQLRHAPVISALRGLLAEGAIGEPIDLEMRVVCSMPWHQWPFLQGMPRMELLMHSIHYLDLARSLFGEPERVWCATARHPAAPGIADARSTTVLTFGACRRAVVTTFHHHEAPQGHDASHLRIEGTRGTAVARLGVNLDYPRGRPDSLEWSSAGSAWRLVPLAGNWFPDAFGRAMLALQDFAAGRATRLESDPTDAWRTMALVETCYKSAAAGERVPPPPTGT